jgi:filamentous hemagglutinin
MNKHLHRIVFNAARGLRMVVQESARSTGKGASGATSAAVSVGALAAALMSAPLHAQIVADPGAPGRQRPTLLAAPNGVPLVNIQTPSAAGVSRNTYSQFDVNAKGVILNNSRTNAQTQLGGWVQGNPWLAGGGARVILNEVNSANPSQLRGYVEVAGQRAEVIIANPAGIQVNGGGFINASRATLTTGTPQFNAQGGLDSFLVRGGTVNIEGTGLDASKTDYAAILARAVQLNAGVWANELEVVAGANQVAVDGSVQAPVTPTGNTPAFALDVAALGGMYAGKITLVGTEAGLGVRNAGHLGAGVGGLVVTAAGRLENIGTLEGAKVDLRGDGDIDNRGGTIRQGGTRDLAITAPVLSNTAGGVIGAEPVAVQPEMGGGGPSTPANPSSGGSVTPTTGTPTTPATGGTVAAEAAPAQPAAATGPGAINAAGSVLNDGGRIYAGGEIGLDTPRIDNSGGSLSVGTLAVRGERFSNAGGTLNVARGFSADVGRFDNSGGKLNAGSLRIASTGELLNTDGTLTSEGDASLAAGGDIDNTRGTVTAVGALDVHAAATLHNAAGALRANNDLVVVARTVDNRHNGEILQTGNGTLRIDATGALNNDGGRIGANGADMHLKAATLGNAAGTITHVGSGTAEVDAGRYDGAGGRITGEGALVVKAGDFDSAYGHLGAARITLDAASLGNARGEIVAVQGDLQLTVDGAIDNAGGKLQAQGRTDLRARSLDNTAGTLTGKGMTVDTRGGTLDNRRGTLVSTAALALKSGVLHNDGGLIQSTEAMTLDTGGEALHNTGAATHASGKGGVASGGALTLTSGRVDNSAGFIGARGALVADTRGVVNADGGLVLGQSTLDVLTGGADYDNGGGQTQAAGTLHIDAGAQGSVRNTGGLIRSEADLGLEAAQVDNQATQGPDQGIEGLNLTLRAATLDNHTGALRATGRASIEAGTRVDNSGGLVSARDTLHVVDPGTGAKTLAIVNTAGTMVADKGLDIDAASLRNDGGGKLVSGKNLGLSVAQDIVNDGQVRADGDLRYNGGGKLSNNGLMSAGQTLTVQGGEIENGSRGEMAGGSTTTVMAKGTLTNHGLIDGQETRIDAGALINGITGRIYGDHLSIAASSVLNDGDGEHGGSIAARQRLDIGAGRIENRNGALIFSAGDLAIGGALDADRHATGRTGELSNHAATIEALGRVDIGATQLHNTNGGVTWTMAQGPRTHVVEYAVPGSAQRWKAEDVLFILGGYTGIANSAFTTIAAPSPYVPGDNPNYRLLLTSPDYPLAKFRPYYTKSPRNSADESYVNCTGGDGDNCATVKQPGAWYGIGDPIWADFGVTPPAAELPAGHPARIDPNITVGQAGIVVQVSDPGGVVDVLQPSDHPVTQAEYDQWQAYRQAHRQLDEATEKFVRTMTGSLGKPGRIYNTYDAWDYDLQTQTPVLQSSAPGKILAGGAMHIDVGQGRNEMSQILAGGELKVTGGTVKDIGQEVDAPTTRTGTTVHSYIKTHTFDSDERRYDKAAYNLSEPGTVTLAAGRQKGFTAVNGEGELPGPVATGASAQGATGGGTVNANTPTAPIVEVPQAPGASGGKPVSIRTGTPPLGLPTASLFRTGNDGRYLVETDPRFVGYRNWLSSDYLFNALGVKAQ